MQIKTGSYIKIVLLHLLLGVVVFLAQFVSLIYGLLILITGIIYIVKNKNQNNEVLIASAYLVGAEVFLRMTNGTINNEFGKYGVILFMFLGFYYSNFSKNSFLYWVFILLLIPGIILGASTLSFETDIRKAIAFNLSGPVCLAICSIYTFQRRINMREMEKILAALLFPVIAMLSYMFLYAPSIKDVVTGTDSNFATSGGFGPNQVSTALGLGMFVVFVRLVLYSKGLVLILLNIFLFLFLSYRGVITFSRGGVYAGLIMILLLLMTLYWFSNLQGKIKIKLILFFSVFAGMAVFAYSSYQTGGMIDKRYAGQDALGREKTSKFSGREVLVETELGMFMDNPITGIGVGKNKEFREETTGIVSASHNEISRMLAEHGILGIINLLILFITPLILYIDNKQNIYVLSFYIFWMLTINHASMRITAPAFIYALSLLKVYNFEKPAVHRE